MLSEAVSPRSDLRANVETLEQSMHWQTLPLRSKCYTVVGREEDALSGRIDLPGFRGNVLKGKTIDDASDALANNN